MIGVLIHFSRFSDRPETKEGKEGGEQEKSNEQEGTEGDKIEKELEKDKVRLESCKPDGLFLGFLCKLLFYSTHQGQG